MKLSVVKARLLTASIFALALLASAPARAESIFPDKSLEAVVRQYVFEKRNNDQPLEEKDVENISTIVGKGKGIKDLTGLEKCRSLALLDLENNEIESVEPIKDLKKLQSLTLAKNKIKDASPLAELKGLQYLQLEENQIEDIGPLSGLENMRSLYLSGNKIKSIEPVKGLAKVWSLYLDDNQLEKIDPVSELKSLSTLSLRNNRVSDPSPLSGLTELRFLFLEGNQVKDLGVLVEMAKKDYEGQQRFAPFWHVNVSNNPLSDKARKEQLPQLKEHAREVKFDDKSAG